MTHSLMFMLNPSWLLPVNGCDSTKLLTSSHRLFVTNERKEPQDYYYLQEFAGIRNFAENVNTNGMELTVLPTSIQTHGSKHTHGSFCRYRRALYLYCFRLQHCQWSGLVWSCFVSCLSFVLFKSSVLPFSQSLPTENKYR